MVSQAEVEAAGGLELTSFTIQLQEKLEELYLHVIAMDKRVAELEAENAALQARLTDRTDQENAPTSATAESTTTHDHSSTSHE